MSIFGSLMADVEDDPIFGSHMRHMNHMMNSFFSDPFGMGGFGGGPLAIGPPHGSSLMPFMPQMPGINSLINCIEMAPGTSYSSQTVVMSSGPNGSPQVYSSSSSTKIGPNGLKETRKTLQDTRTGTKKMSIGHHIGDRAHVIEREQNVYSGDAEERQEFINIEEEEADDFNREFRMRSGNDASSGRARLALPAPPTSVVAMPNTRVREVYGASHPNRNRPRSHKSHRSAPSEN
ncbi:hypothetical protein ACJJTC_012566 [Scirpophaga incertulas]